VHVPLSGEQSIYGLDILRAAELAVQQLALPINELGYKVELVSYDDQANIEVGVTNAKELVADPQILCGVGHFNSRVMIQASEIYHREGLAFVSPSNTSATVTDRGYLEVNRVVGRDDGQGIVGAQFAKAQNFASVYIIYQSSDFARINADNFKREANQIGVKVVGTVNSDATEDFSGVIGRMMNTNPDLVYFSGFAGQAGPLIRQARAAGYTGAFLLIDDNPALADLAGPLSIEGGGTFYTSIAVPASLYPEAASFVVDFDNRYAAFPQLYAAQAYDATGICLKAIEESSKAKSGELPTRNEVASAIHALQEYKGITGTYSFNKKGDPISVKYFVSKLVSIDSSNWGQNTMVATFEVEPPK
jgi:branched-chain amino acid transport system substrate-binding protein